MSENFKFNLNDFNIAKKHGKAGLFLPTAMVNTVERNIDCPHLTRATSKSEERLIKARCFSIISYFLKNGFTKNNKPKPNFFIPTKQLSKEDNKALLFLVKIGIIIRNGVYVIDNLCYEAVLNCFHTAEPMKSGSDSFITFQRLERIPENEMYSSVSHVLHEQVLIHRVTTSYYKQKTKELFHKVFNKISKSNIKHWTFVPFESLYKHKGKIMNDIDIAKYNSNYENASDLEKLFIKFNKNAKLDTNLIEKLLRRFRYKDSLESLLYSSGENLTRKQEDFRQQILQFMFNDNCRKSVFGRCYHKLTNLDKRIKKCIVTNRVYGTADIKAALPSLFLSYAINQGYEIESDLIKYTKQGLFYEKIGKGYKDFTEDQITNDPKCRSAIKVRFMKFLGIILRDGDDFTETKLFEFGQSIAVHYPKFIAAIYDVKEKVKSLARLLQDEESKLLIDIALKYDGITLHDELIVPIENLNDAMREVQERNDFIKFETGIFGSGAITENTKILNLA